MSTPTNPLKTLSFTPLAPHTHLLARPSATTTLLLCTWLSAPLRYLTPYLTHHAQTHPHANLLLLQSTFTTLYAHPGAAAAAAVLRATPRVLAHVFSNGGCSSLHSVLRAYGPAPPLPLVGTVFDSAPGAATFVRSIAPLTHPLRGCAWYVRLPAQAAVVAALGVVWVVEPVLQRVGWGADFITPMREALNDETLVRREGNRRVYVYSQEDGMVDWREVERHAEQARSRGWEVRLERFGGGHVAHVRDDGERYWAVVEAAWESEGGGVVSGKL
ncbi:hypothetical protein EDC01DRAFT_30235 [Geopyxis carbonaria]|nr:hypothetical protein EDC01DRAFT_30235 [Geopyxis carbonaria]